MNFYDPYEVTGLEKFLTDKGTDNISKSVIKELMPFFVTDYKSNPNYNFANLETLAYKMGKLSCPFSFGATFLSCVIPVLKYGSTIIQKDLLKGIETGEIIISNCATEPLTGSDVFNMQTAVKKEKEHYVINGTKVFVTNAGISNYALVYAKNQLDKNIELFLVDMCLEGVDVISLFPTMGLKNSSLGQITFNNVICGEECRISKEFSGKIIFAESMVWERLGLTAVHLGILQNVLQQCRMILQNKKISNQSIWHSLAVYWSKIEAVKSLLYSPRLNSDKIRPAFASMCKLLSSELFTEIANFIPLWFETPDLANSVISEFILDAPATTIYSGTSEIQKEIISSYFKIREL